MLGLLACFNGIAQRKKLFLETSYKMVTLFSKWKYFYEELLVR